MNILYGVSRWEGTVSEVKLCQIGAATQRYSDADTYLLHGSNGFGMQPFRTHARETMQTAPCEDELGNIACFDGRLDNYLELADECGLHGAGHSDMAIVLAAFRRWNTGAFQKLTGDWALVLWSAVDRTLFLARDHAGTRSLYFSEQQGSVYWGSFLDSLVAAGCGQELSSLYAFRYVAALPLRDLTPYEDIRAVRPGHFLTIRETGMQEQRHWCAYIPHSIRYTSDEAYEEHCLTLFRSSVQRRIGTGSPILAQLSGGLDSTSIVCMADVLRREQGGDLLDTISYFDDSEVSLDEKRYFQITEAYRGRCGVHVDMGFAQRTFGVPPIEAGHYCVPGADSFSVQQEERIDALLESGNYRRVLSGIGGDEVWGGVPDPRPELADLLFHHDIRGLWKNSVGWALRDRTPLYQLLLSVSRYTCALRQGQRGVRQVVPAWLRVPHGEAQGAYNAETLFGAIDRHAEPSRIENAWTWWAILETLPHLTPQLLFRREYLYPMLDKDLVEFLFAIPHNQILRVGERRSLMKRSLGHLLPSDVLHRKQKAYQLRAPIVTIRDSADTLTALFEHSLLEELGWIDPKRVVSEIERMGRGASSELRTLLRAVAYELWLRTRMEWQPNRRSEAIRQDWSLHGGQYQPLRSH